MICLYFFTINLLSITGSLRVHDGFIANHLRHITTSSLLVTEVDFFTY